MNAHNELLRRALSNAIAALFFLSDAGATAVSVEVRGGRPVILLDGPPSSPMIKGVLRKSSPSLHGRNCVMVAVVLGCQVEWTVRTVRDAIARVGA